MPNHVINKVSFSEDREKILAYVKSKESDFDFNTIISMPKELEGISSPAKVLTGVKYDIAMKEYQESDGKDVFKSKPITFEEEKELLKKFGASDWYKWNIKNWGTKWNAYDIITEYNELEFQTAWSTPVPIFEALSKIFPNVIINVRYADEDIGSNCGSYELKNGKIISEENGDAQFACEMWGNDYQEYLDEQKEYA